jgi:flagellar M-ring protein FliF
MQMAEVLRYVRGQKPGRLVAIACAVALALACILGLARVAARPSMELLFAGLDAGAASSVTAALEERAVEYEVRSGAIFVAADRRDELRLALAPEATPGYGIGGYEVLDELSGFGTTSQMFDAAYWRAKEGELARTILSGAGFSGAGVEAARVHIAASDDGPFARTRQPSASVTLRSRGGPIPKALADAVRSLVAGAVPGLTAASVAVIDGRSGRIVPAGDAEGSEEGQLNRSERMRRAVENLLAARLGEGRFVVELSLETERDTERVVERIIDPESRTVVSAETEERSLNEQGTGPSGVTVASNLPDGDAGGESSSVSQSREARERLNYEHSSIDREIERRPGGTKRITVAVLVDGVVTETEDGDAEWEPLAEAELLTLRELVQSAIGYDEARGDLVTVRSLRFQQRPVLGSEATSSPWLSGPEVVRLAAISALLVAVLVALLVAKRTIRQTAAQLRAAPEPEGGASSLPAPREDAQEDRGRALPSPVVGTRSEAASPMGGEMEGAALLGDAVQGDEPSPEAQDPVARLQQLISERREETVEVLRGWIEGQDRGAESGAARKQEATS